MFDPWQTVVVQCKLYRAYREARKPYACVHHLFFRNEATYRKEALCSVGEVDFFFSETMPDTILTPPGSPSANGRAPPPGGIGPRLPPPPPSYSD